MDQDERRGGSGEVARGLVEATFRGDVDTATSLCTPDLELRIEGTQVVRGRDGLAQLIEFNEEVSTDVRVEIRRVLSSGDTAAVSRTTFLTIGGTPITLAVGAFFTLRDGLVSEWCDYQDMGEVTRALGH
ncbi:MULTISPECIES: nuclear transport factor 2 family protein [unclassified Dietzia]|uniref:nuclear transport factor 2 family protein n=1 Tax=unclassified Dietzia TaxID=2617939 RepID=UPI0015F94D85|nr:MULTISPECIES: nuclear transport factor 2 family protein [unclassified Dietzia]MBB1025937.1 nuclear transport factor 2 family protein [Dietzia sp. DQ12-76]MBB1029171.1 nuclear transport factor 2 family protein [Dietzia sp. DQ11-38-2]